MVRFAGVVKLISKTVTNLSTARIDAPALEGIRVVDGGENVDLAIMAQR